MPLVRVGQQGVHDEREWQRTGLATSSRGAKELRVDRMKFKGGEARQATPHQHDHEEITIVLSGSVTHTLGDEKHLMSAGDVIIVPPGVLHGGNLESGQECEALVIHPAGTKFLEPDGKEMPMPAWFANP